MLYTHADLLATSKMYVSFFTKRAWRWNKIKFTKCDENFHIKISKRNQNMQSSKINSPYIPSRLMTLIVPRCVVTVLGWLLCIKHLECTAGFWNYWNASCGSIFHIQATGRYVALRNKSSAEFKKLYRLLFWTCTRPSPTNITQNLKIWLQQIAHQFYKCTEDT